MGWRTCLERLIEAAPGIDWIRIMYAYPGYVTDRLIEVMAANPQHRALPGYAAPARPSATRCAACAARPTSNWVYRTLEKMRRAMPDLALRTTFIVGYPGETEDEFQTLLDFMQEIRFDRVGAFQFSFEPGTPASPWATRSRAEVKEERYERLDGPAAGHLAGDATRPWSAKPCPC